MEEYLVNNTTRNTVIIPIIHARLCFYTKGKQREREVLTKEVRVSKGEEGNERKGEETNSIGFIIAS